MGIDTINNSTIYTRPTFLSGVASVLDLSANLKMYNYSTSENSADRRALKNDWIIVGHDINEVIKNNE